MNKKQYDAKRYIRIKLRRAKQMATYYKKNRRAIIQKGRAAYRADPEKKKALTRESNYRKWYGITEADYQGMLAKQGGKCFLCKTTKPGGRYKRLCVDHNHKTGKVRKLLCRNCNLGIGNLQDNPRLLRKAAKYVETTYD